MIDLTIADRVKELREKQGLSQETLAKKIGLKDKSSIAKIEKSGNKITLKHVEKLASALNTTIPYLMGWDENSESTSEYNREENFVKQYNQLNEYQKSLVDNMIAALTEKK